MRSFRRKRHWSERVMAHSARGGRDVVGGPDDCRGLPEAVISEQACHSLDAAHSGPERIRVDGVGGFLITALATCRAGFGAGGFARCDYGVGTVWVRCGSVVLHKRA